MATISYEEYVAFVQYATSDGYFWFDGDVYVPERCTALGNGCYHYKPAITGGT